MRYLCCGMLCLVVAGCARQGDPRLAGTFISDKEATMAYLRSTAKGEAKKLQALERLSRVFGKLKVTYEGNYVTTELDGVINRERFEILKSTDTSVVTRSELLGEKTEHTIEFCENGYWVSGGILQKPFREKFVRIE